MKLTTYTALLTLGGALAYFAVHSIRRALEKADAEVTLRQQAEATLRAKEAQLRVVTDNMQEMVLLMDTQGTVQYANPASSHLVGYAPEWVIGKSSLAFMHPDDLRLLMPMFQAAVEGKQTDKVVEFRCRHAEGHYVLLEATGQVLFESGTATGIVAVFRNVTARKQMEVRLVRQNITLSNLYQVMLDILKYRVLDDLLQEIVLKAVGLLDATYGEIMLLEDDALVVQAVTPNQGSLIGERVAREDAHLSWQAVLTHEPVFLNDYAAWEYRRDVYDPNLHAVADFPIMSGERCVGVLALGRQQPDYPFDEEHVQAGRLFAQLAALALDNAHLYAAAQSELTERKQTELSLRASNREFQKQNEELDAFAHTVAHDLKNPIGIIQGFAELLLNPDFSLSEHERAEAVQHIYRNTVKATTIIEALLVLASVRKQDVEMEPLPMSVIVAEALQRLATTIEEKKITIHCVAQEEWPPALGYKAWVEELWINYLNNAFKYGGQSPQIELSAAAQCNGMVRFNVRDNGPGLTPAEQERLFTPFERLGQTHTKGYGLGLSIVQRIVEKLGGQVGVESQVGQGSTFYFTLRAA